MRGPAPTKLIAPRASHIVRRARVLASIDRGAITQLTAGAGLTGSQNGGAATLAVSLGYEIVSLTPAVPPGAHTRFVSCPSGKRAVGGGYDSIGPMTINGSWPTVNGEGWRVAFVNSTANTYAPAIHAICVVVQ